MSPPLTDTRRYIERELSSEEESLITIWRVLMRNCLVVLLSLSLCVGLATAGEKARVFVTDSQSWEMSGSSGGSSSAFGGHVSGGARPQTGEIVKTFTERCPDVVINNIREKADYVVVLDHEGGKG